MRYRVQKAASTPAEKPVNKLSDITVEEVSIVDRPANRRQFLIIKSAVGAPAEKPAPMQISAKDKATLTRKVQAANAAIEAMQAALDSAEEADGATVPDELTNAMDAVSKLLGKAAPKEEPKPEPKPEAKPEPKAEDDVNKAGRKFSAANEQKLRDAQKLIAELLGDGAKADDSPDVPETAATAKTETQKAEDKPDATAIALNSLTDTVATMIRAMKAQKARIDELTTSTPGSRQVNTEKSDEDEKPPAEDAFSWPMDMNRPHTRANTPIEKSFFES